MKYVHSSIFIIDITNRVANFVLSIKHWLSHRISEFFVSFTNACRPVSRCTLLIRELPQITGQQAGHLIIQLVLKVSIDNSKRRQSAYTYSACTSMSVCSCNALASAARASPRAALASRSNRVTSRLRRVSFNKRYFYDHTHNDTSRPSRLG